MNKLIAAVATAASLMASQASALGVNITSISGIWTSATGGGGTVTGLGSADLRWGGSSPKSGYDFDAATTPFNVPAVNQLFSLGTFTHINNPIQPPSITGALLQLTIGLNIDNIAQQIIQTYQFAHVETDNQAPCQFPEGPNTPPCADKVTAVINTASVSTFTIGDTEYAIRINGFTDGNGNLFKEFLTREQASNSIQLTGSYDTKVNVVPVPAAGLMLLTIMAGLGVLSRRKAA